eukprot:CAMPEP_0195521974 /NCGR_PEP_ID=MMETSP0794_2-20130614/19822_1 /TAXON_ID=515487 /ORGANISM="Stephanopyxis turris, Strain CCMP 815" /LENGTH=71 /DNA_ID=CAMNT_0040651643 /DNA_START=58 /DNA_END=273 /DNA_ORIENTATION=+
MVWKAQDAWRSHPSLVPKGPFQFMPGLSKALIAFGAFVVVEKVYSVLGNKGKADHAHEAADAHGAAHGDKH